METNKETKIIENPDNKQKISIVVVGYNRLKSIQRLLTSILNAHYPCNDIPLIISIDCSGCTELYDYVHKFEWPFGEKYVIIQKERLGLKEHIFRCGDLTYKFKAVILLEDDLFVSPYFYYYVQQAIDKYGEEEDIAEISLYKNERNGYVGLPFCNLQNGSDVFLMQDVSTWGECWTEQMWDKFRAWYNNECSEKTIFETDMSSIIKGWTRAWSKYYNAYVVQKNKYVLYPNVSLSTNFGDAGEHADIPSTEVQVSLQMSNFEYRMPPIEKLIKYDIYFNNEAIYDWIGMTQDCVTLDIYGFHSLDTLKSHLLSTKILPYKVVKSYGLCLRPLELNIRYNISGNSMFLYDTRCHSSSNARKYNHELTSYFLQGVSRELLGYQYIQHIKSLIKTVFLRVLNKLKKCF